MCALHAWYTSCPLPKFPGIPIHSRLWLGPVQDKDAINKRCPGGWAAWGQNHGSGQQNTGLLWKRAGEHHVSQHLGPTIHPRILRNAQRTFLLFAATNVILCLKVSGKISGQKFQRPFPFSRSVLEGDPGPSQGRAPSRQHGDALFPLVLGLSCSLGPSVAPAPHALVHLTLIGRARSTEPSCCGLPALSTHTLVGTPTLPARPHFSCPSSGGQGHLPALWEHPTSTFSDNTSTALPQASALIGKQPAEVLV